MAKTWTQSLSNRRVELLDLRPEMVGGIEEIAHALAGKVRFSGQTKLRYSVAEHCVLGAALFADRGLARSFLLHELSEVYLPDIPGPLKSSVRVDVGAARLPWVELEARHTSAILEALGHSEIEYLIYSTPVKQMDMAMLAAEKRDLCGPEPAPWGLTVLPAPVNVGIPWSASIAADTFLHLYRKLFK